MTVARERVAVVGHPVSHSLSPAIHNAAFAAAGLPWEMIAQDVSPEDGPGLVAAAREQGLRGLAVTMPHKVVVAETVDSLDPAASALRSVNTVVFADGTAHGLSTDGDGFVDSLRAAGHDPAGTTVVLIGAGAAARSIVDGLSRAGAARVLISNRTPAAAEEAARLASVAEAVESGGVAAAIAAADIVVNTTSVGMGADSDSCPIEPSLLTGAHVIVDIVYHPL
ncbi:MAG: shikimate dehydrogenase family protein, partial [Ilumatobacteraceae bacterium]